MIIGCAPIGFEHLCINLGVVWSLRHVMCGGTPPTVTRCVSYVRRGVPRLMRLSDAATYYPWLYTLAVWLVGTAEGICVLHVVCCILSQGTPCWIAEANRVGGQRLAHSRVGLVSGQVGCHHLASHSCPHANGLWAVNFFARTTLLTH